MRANPVLLFTLIVSLGGFIFGFDAAVISGATGLISTEFALDPIQQGFVVGAPTLGGILATLLAGYICDTIGRRSTLMIIALLYLVSAVFSAFAPGYEFLVAARFIGGLAFCSLMIAPMYIAEISPAHQRGKMVSVNQLNIVLGFSAAYFANYYVLKASQSDLSWVQALALDTHTWRWMLGIEILPALCYFLLLFVIPKSPRWLVVQARETEAAAVLARLEPDASEQKIQTEIREIKASTQTPAPVLERVKEIVGPSMRLAILIGLIVGIAQQATGVNAIYFYAPSIFEQSGVGTNAAFAQAIWIGVINVLFTLVAMVLIDKLGRKPLLMIGLIGVVISMSICAYGYQQATYELTSEDIIELSEIADQQQLLPLANQVFEHDVTFKKAVIAQIGEQTFQTHQGKIIQLAASLNAPLILLGILGFVASFAVSLGPVMWVLFSEIFPNHLRGLAISAVGVVNSIVSFIVQVVFPWELANLGTVLTFSIYGGFALLGLVLVIKFVPETKGKSLEELERELNQSAPEGAPRYAE